jgi:CelD/BcsL family acetyltransferase involved in cellulose biosynthesis
MRDQASLVMTTSDRGVRLEAVWVQEEAKFLALKEQWNQLAARTDPKCVFLRHEWFESAWQWAKTDAALRILCLYHDGALIGICPLVARTRKRSAITTRALEFLAIPDTQRCDVLAAPERLREVLAGVARALCHPPETWDTLDMAYVADGSALLVDLPAALARHRISASPRASGHNPTIELQRPWEEFYKERGRRLKKSNNLVANRLGRTGKVDILWSRDFAQDLESLDQWLRQIVDVSASSWKNEILLSLNHAGPGRFIRRLSELASDQGWLSLWVLKLNDNPVAMEYQLAYQGQVHALRADFNQACEELSPGSHLNWKLLERLFQSGLERYYMGPGDNAYKRRWTEGGNTVFRLVAYNNTLAGRLLKFIELKLRPIVRRARNRLTPPSSKEEE